MKHRTLTPALYCLEERGPANVGYLSSAAPGYLRVPCCCWLPRALSYRVPSLVHRLFSSVSVLYSVSVLLATVPILFSSLSPFLYLSYIVSSLSSLLLFFISLLCPISSLLCFFLFSSAPLLSSAFLFLSTVSRLSFSLLFFLYSSYLQCPFSCLLCPFSSLLSSSIFSCLPYLSYLVCPFSRSLSYPVSLSQLLPLLSNTLLFLCCFSPFNRDPILPSRSLVLSYLVSSTSVTALFLFFAVLSVLCLSLSFLR